MRQEGITARETVIIGLLYLFALFSFNEEINSIMLYTAVPMAFVLSLITKTNRSKPYFYKGVIYLYVWILVTACFAIDYGAAFSELKKCLGVFMLIVIMHRVAVNERVLPWLYGVWIIYYFMLIHFAYNLFTSGQFIFGEERLADESFNPNALGYFTFFFSFIIYILPHVINNKSWKKFLYIVFLFLIPWSFVLSIISGSRQVLLVQIPLFAVFLYIRYMKSEGGGNKFINIFVPIFLVIVFFVSFNKISSIYSNSILHTRSEQSVNDDERTILFKDAVHIGMEHPIVGVGPGNYGRLSVLKLYSHNTYSELFANCGAIALLIYIGIELSFLIRQYKRYRRTKDPMFLSFSAFGILFILDSAFNVFYIVIWLLPFFFLVAEHSEVYYKNHYSLNKAAFLE